MGTGIVITSNRAGTAAITVKVGTLIVATGKASLAIGPDTVPLCLNRAGRRYLEAAPRSVRSLRARVTVAAQAGAETARASAFLRLPLHS
jgi:hypothetical protein